MVSSLIRGKYVICKILSRTEPEVIEDGAVFQRDGTIVDIGPYEPLAATYEPDEVLGSDAHVVMPGLVNSHHHVGLTPFQLGSPDYALELWFASRLGHARSIPILIPCIRPSKCSNPVSPRYSIFMVGEAVRLRGCRRSPLQLATLGMHALSEALSFRRALRLAVSGKVMVENGQFYGEPTDGHYLKRSIPASIHRGPAFYITRHEKRIPNAWHMPRLAFTSCYL
jgi:hypothetical protein